MAMNHIIGNSEPFDKERHKVTSYLSRFSKICLANLIIPPAQPEPPQDPDDAAAADYAARMATYRNHLEIYQIRKKASFLAVIGEETFRDLQNKCLPSDPSAKTYDQLVEIFRELYIPKVLQTTAQLRFEEGMQKESESLSDFILEIQHLAKDCELGTYYDSALKIKLLNGVRPEKLKFELKKSAPETYPQAVKLAQKLDMSVIEEKAVSPVNKILFHNKNKGCPSSSSRGKDFTPPIQSFNKKQSYRPGNRNETSNRRENGNNSSTRGTFKRFNLPQVMCYRCGLFHDPKDCPTKNWSCNNCGKVGHRQRMCCAEKSIKESDDAEDSHSNHSYNEDEEEEEVIVGKILEVSDEDIVINLDQEFKYLNPITNDNVYVPVRELSSREDFWDEEDNEFPQTDLVTTVKRIKEDRVNTCKDNIPLTIDVNLAEGGLTMEIDTGSW